MSCLLMEFSTLYFQVAGDPWKLEPRKVKAVDV